MQIKAGDIIEGHVTNTTDYGAFVELAPDVTGLIHISALSDDYVRRVTDIVRTGDLVKVEVLNIDERGRYKLQRIAPDGEKRREPDHEDPEQPDEREQPRGQERRPEREMRGEREPRPERGEPRRRSQPRKEEAPPPVETEPLQPEEDSAREFEDRW
ncbi:MAG: S1 RNA-binding domain-containing protein [Candidatus Bipolaricaulis sp.]|nr:S1 RNA-binding domain-containing protein [Candidatus Bipolaricaulis sp.]